MQINGGRVEGGAGDPFLLTLPAISDGYAVSQIDDYHGRRRRDYPWRATVGARLSLTATFSHGADKLQGTAGFGFWNAPFSDPNVRWPALPQAAWFFFGSAPNDLPLAPEGPGRGWFASTVDATTPQALALAPLAPLVVAANHIAPFRARVWPRVQRALGISFAALTDQLTEDHQYTVEWSATGCRFAIDGATVLATPIRLRGPLGFVCWLDNQYLIVRPTGRLRAGVIATSQEQWLQVTDLQLTPIH